MTENNSTTRRGRPRKPQAINTAIVAIMREVGPIAKECKNEDEDWSYRSIEQVYNRAQPLFAEHGVFCIPEVLEHNQRDLKAKSGSFFFWTSIKARFRFTAEDDTYKDVIMSAEAMDDEDKSTNKALSVAHRYAICMLLMIPYEMYDPDATTPKINDESLGQIALAAFNQIKIDWMEFSGTTIADADDKEKIEKVSKEFSQWVSETTDREFNPLDFRQWQLSDIEECKEAMNGAKAQVEMAMESDDRLE